MAGALETAGTRVRSTSCRCSWSRPGPKIDEVTAKLFAENHYRDYHELNGLDDAAHRGARRVLARPRPLGARLRGRGSRGHRGYVQARLPRCAVLARLPRVPGHGGPPQGRELLEARADGR